MRKVLKKLVPNSMIKKYHQAKFELNKAKNSIIKGLNENKHDKEDSRYNKSEVKDSEKNKSPKYFSLFSAGLALTSVAIGIIGLTGIASGFAAPFIFGALALDIIGAAIEINRVSKERRQEQKPSLKKKSQNKKVIQGEENTLATQKSLSDDTLSLSSEGSDSTTRKIQFQPRDLNKLTKVQLSKAQQNNSNKRKPRMRNPRNKNGVKLSF